LRKKLHPAFSKTLALQYAYQGFDCFSLNKYGEHAIWHWPLTEKRLRAWVSYCFIPAISDSRAQIRRGLDVNNRSSDGLTLLMHHAQDSDLRQMHVLLDAHANVNLIDDDGWTALHYASAAAAQDLDAVRLLLDRKADSRITSVRPKNFETDTDWEDCDPRLFDHYGPFLAPLDIAREMQQRKCGSRAECTCNSCRICNLLESRKERKQQVGTSASQQAGSELLVSVARVKSESAHLDQYDDFGMTRFHHAARRGDVRKTLEYFNLVSDVDVATLPHGFTALALACMKSGLLPDDAATKVALQLLRLGADPNKADAFGWSPLHHALMHYGCVFGNTDLIFALLDAKANPDLRISSDGIYGQPQTMTTRFAGRITLCPSSAQDGKLSTWAGATVLEQMDFWLRENNAHRLLRFPQFQYYARRRDDPWGAVKAAGSWQADLLAARGLKTSGVVASRIAKLVWDDYAHEAIRSVRQRLESRMRVTAPMSLVVCLPRPPRTFSSHEAQELRIDGAAEHEQEMAVASS
jgi:ankyrin repeat protein